VSRPGALGRSAGWWPEIVFTGRTYLFGVREQGELTGYIAYSKEPAVGLDMKYYFDVEVQDVAWTTRSAGLSLLGLLASHTGLGVSLRWPGHAGDLWARALSGQAPRIAFAYPWMLRIVDVERALTQRGYPRHVKASVALSVVDDVLPDNAKAYRLDVADGQAAVSTAAHADASIDVGALAPLYSGYLSAAELAAEGRLTGTSDAEVAALDSLFAGPRPLLTDMF
jgi:predicted acetyltransferase